MDSDGGLLITLALATYAAWFATSSLLGISHFAILRRF
jgi:hypothetical protein